MNEPDKIAKKWPSKSFGRINLLFLFAVLVSLKHIGYGAEPSTSNNGTELATDQTDIHNKSKYDAATEKEKEKSEIERLSKKVAELNINADRDGRRRAELEAAISDGRGGSDAMGELQRLRKSQAIEERERYILELDAKGIELSKNIAATRVKIEKLNTSRDSWFNRNKTSELDAEERKLVGWLSSLASANRINSILLERLRSGATTFSDGTMNTPQDLQERFFPTR